MKASIARHSHHPEVAPTTAAETLVRVNIGCGTTAAAGWHNFDNSPSLWLSRVPMARLFRRTPQWPRNVICYDVLKGLPFQQASVDVIYSSHTFEHFTYAQSLGLAKECFRVLKRGGILRIVVPDLERMVRDYFADPAPFASHRFVERLLLRQSWRDLFHTGAHHRQMFDGRSLVAMLGEAGFADATVSSFGLSKIPGVLDVELSERRRESLYVETEKAEAEAVTAKAELVFMD